VSADADRIPPTLRWQLCRHDVQLSSCSECALQRIAQLTAELAEARRELDYIRGADREVAIRVDELLAERAAHERTKAELAAERKDRSDAADSVYRALTDGVAARIHGRSAEPPFEAGTLRCRAWLIGYGGQECADDRDAAQSELARLHAAIDAHLPRYALDREGNASERIKHAGRELQVGIPKIDEMANRLFEVKAELAEATKRANEVPGLSAALDEARWALEQVRDNRACGSQTCGQIAERVLAGSVNVERLRALAARVPLLDALADAVRAYRDAPNSQYFAAMVTALDAVHAKGGVG
jgi:hypothetical protein